MEQINIERAEQIVSEIKDYINGNIRLEELFTTKPSIKMDVYNKTAIFYAQKKYEEHQASSEAIPHGFYQILENEIKNIGFIKTIKKYDKQIQIIADTINKPKSEIIQILNNLRTPANTTQDTPTALIARNSLKELFRKFTAKYKENYLKRIIDEKLALLEQNTIRINSKKNEYALPIAQFVESFLRNSALTEALTSIINKKIGVYPTKSQLKETIEAIFDKDFIETLKRIYKIQKPESFQRFEENKIYVRLKRNYEPKLNELFGSFSEEEKQQIIKVLEIKKRIKELQQKQEHTNEEQILNKLKAVISHDHQTLLEEISTLIFKGNCNLTLVNGKFVFDIEAKVTKEESTACKKYIALEKSLKTIHNFIYPYYRNQNKLINAALNKAPTPLTSNEDNYQINADIWLTKEKIIKAIDSIDTNKLNNMSPENFQLLKKFLIEDGLLWAYIADNVDLNIFAKIINNFDSISACCKPEEISIENLHEIIKKANLYDYANDLIIGLVGLDITAKVINYNQFSGVTVTDEVIHQRLRKLVDLAVRSERITKSSLPFGCNVKLDGYSLLRYQNNDPTIFTSGIDTKTCFFISVNENDFFFYSLLNKNGYVIKIVDKNQNLIARATCFRKNNVLMINGIRCKNNKVTPQSQEETREMIEIVKLVKLMSQKMIELTTQDECPIDYVVCNKAGILENNELDTYFQFESINASLFREPINIYDEDWQEFVHTYDGQEQLLQEVPNNPEKSFTTDFGNHYPAILITSRNYMPLTSPRDISLNDQPATYTRPRKPIEEYISEELTEEIIAKINRIRALACFTGTPEEQETKKNNYTLIRNKKELKSTIIGDDWCILITQDNKYDVYFANYTSIAKSEVQSYILRLQETMSPYDIEDLRVKNLIPTSEEETRQYTYPTKNV